MEQKNGLYHYGVKGMKWGKHLKSKIRDFYNLRITGNDYLEPRARYETHNSNYGYHNSYQYHKDRAASGQYLANKWRDLSRDRSYSYPKSALRQARAENIYSRKHENQANQLLQKYHTKSLKGITESNTKKVKNWISTRPKVVKKKVSEIKEKIAKAESGKKTVTYPLSRDANKKKTKKSTIKSSSHYMSNY